MGNPATPQVRDEQGLIEKPRSAFHLLLGILFFFLLSSGFALVLAQETAAYPDVRVNRVIEIENGGAMVINDTVTLSSGAGQNVRSLSSFQIGFPVEYEAGLTYFLAHDRSGRLQTRLNTSMDGTGVSWINVSFPKSVDVSNGGSYDFTVVYVFSGLVRENQTLFHVDFPVYPSLAEEARFCNVTVTPPAGALLESTPLGFLNGTVDSRQVLYNETGPLKSYANLSSWTEFTAYGFQLLEVEEWRREIGIDGLGGITATDFYQLTNKAVTGLSRLSLLLPSGATDISAQDVYGTYGLGYVAVTSYEEYVKVDVTLREALGTEGRTKLLVTYRLPFWKYVVQNGWQDYALGISLIRPESWVMKRSTVTISLPEGAEFQSSSRAPYYLEKEGLLVKVKFAEHNLTKFHESSISLEYRYLILWASFRPTLWVGTLTAILGGVFFLRRASKPAPLVAMPLSAGVLRRFVDGYEERRRLKLEMESLEREVQRGKISRRRYKLRKSSLDGHLSKLQRNLAELRKEIEATGGRRLERIRQLETAEAEIETLDKDIERVKVRFQRREISAEASRRLLDEYNRIKERAENTIAEVLLRLREEIR